MTMSPQGAEPGRVPCARPGVIVDRGESGHVLQRADSTIAHLLNDTALALWELCDGHTTEAEMVHAVSELFGLTSREAEPQIHQTLRDLTEVGLVDWVGVRVSR